MKYYAVKISDKGSIAVDDTILVRVLRLRQVPVF